MLATPTTPQLAWQRMEMGMFIHFMPSTWAREDGAYDLGGIAPEKLDTDQWVAVAESMGARYIVFVAKHGPGFCYWQTDTTPYGMKQLSWRGGKGDIVADLSRSCRARGMRLGIYITAWDGYWGAGLGGVLGANEAAVRYRAIRGKDLQVTPAAQEAYEQVYRLQITELLTGYGPISEVWFDGGVGIRVTDVIGRHAPEAVVFGAPPDWPHPIRWCGNEDGPAAYPLWNPKSAAVSATYSPSNPEFAGDPRGATWFPVECDTTMRYGPPGYPPKWGWEPNQEHLVRSLDELMTVYEQSVGRGAVLLLNQAPDPSGLIPEPDARRGAELGAEVRRRFARSVAETSGAGALVELDLKRLARLDLVILEEDIARGQRVLSYVVQGLKAGAWSELARGTSIGYRKIDAFAPVAVTRLRLRVLESLAPAAIVRLAAYDTAATARPRRGSDDGV